MKSSLRAKLLVSVGIIIFIVLGSSSFLHIQDLQRDYLEALEWRAEALAQSIVTRIIERYNFNPATKEMLEINSLECAKLYELNQDKNVTHVAVIDEAGVIAAHNDKASWNTPVENSVLLDSLNRRELNTVLENTTYHTIVPIVADDDILLGFVDIGFSRNIVEQKVHQILFQTVGLFALFVILASIATSVLVNLVVTEPIAQLTAVMKEVETGNLDIEAHITTNDELGKLAGAFNQMGSQLKESFQKREELVAELKENNDMLEDEIVERRLVEEALRESEGRYQSLVEVLPLALYRTDREGRVTFGNKAFLEDIGMSFEECLGKTTYDFHPKELAGKYHADDERILQTGESLDEIEKHIAPTGEMQYVQVMKSPVRDLQGNIIGTQGIYWDVSERKRAEEELKQHRDHLEELVKERTAELTTANEQLQREVTERKQTEELLHQRNRELMLLNQVGKMISSTIELDQILATVLRSVRHLLNISSASFWIRVPETGELVCRQAIGPKSEAIVGWRLALGQGIMGQAAQTGETIIVADSRTDTHHYKRVDQKIGIEQRSILGIPFRTKGEVIGVLNLVDTEVGKFTEDDLRLVEPVAAVAANAIENARLYMRAQQEITERKRAEEELQQAKEAAEAANRAKSAFLATMSHEIRTPMNGVIGMTNLLLDTSLTPQQQDFATTIRHSGEALLTIINDILDFSKIEAGKLDLESYPFNLRACVESALDLVAVKVAEKGLNLAYLVDAHVPTAIVGDLTRLRQILLNLLSNAVKFTDKGEVVVNVTCDSPPGRGKGWVNTVTEDYEVSELTPPLPQEGNLPFAPIPSQKRNCVLHFSVRDTGIGIPEDRLNRLFKSFSQVDASTARKYGGTGLGLAISKRLTELMGGTMWVESEMDKGSTFHFTIRAQATDGIQPAYLSSEQPSLHGKRVLIVDDNETNRKILTVQTSSWGMGLVATASGAEALAVLQREAPFDLALLDMQMPEMDGLTLAEAIRQRFNKNELPLIMLTSLVHQEHDDRLREFAALLTKPVKPSQLYNTLVAIFTGESGRRAESPDLSEGLGFDETLGQRVPLRILLAEDNSINQRLALLTLERLGYRADLAGNGIEVLDALQLNPYDVILMDVQMPEMDGLEATRRIRQEFAAGVQPHIIAVTANAMQSDREACLTAGMDDYISKPFHVQELVAALRKCKPAKGERLFGFAQNRLQAKGKGKPAPDPSQDGNKTEEQMLPTPGPSQERNKTEDQISDQHPASILDPAAIKRLEATLGKQAGEMLPVLIDAFFKDAVKLQETARQALEQGQAEELRRAAHTLKSNGKNFGATILADLCQKLENRAKAGELEGTEKVLTQIETEYEAAKAALESVQKGFQ